MLELPDTACCPRFKNTKEDMRDLHEPLYHLALVFRLSLRIGTVKSRYNPQHIAYNISYDLNNPTRLN